MPAHPCEICGSDEHDRDVEIIDGIEWIYCPRFGSSMNLSEHYAEIERLEEITAYEHELQLEKDSASHN